MSSHSLHGPPSLPFLHLAAFCSLKHPRCMMLGNCFALETDDCSPPKREKEKKKDASFVGVQILLTLNIKGVPM